MGKLYIVEWHNEEAKDYVDIIPAEILEANIPMMGLKHFMIGNDGDVIQAAYDVEIRPDGSKLFRYGGANTSHNDAVQVYIGDVKIDLGAFPNTTTLGWREPNETEFEDLPVTIKAGFIEGETVLYTVTGKKRSDRLRDFVHALGRHRGQCDACKSTPHPGYGEAGFAMFESHHVNPLHLGVRESGIDDMAYLCANCHRVITRLGNPSIEDFIKRLRNAES